MLTARVLAERRLSPLLFEAHHATKYRHPLRKAAFFALAEGPAAALRKSRSKLVERRIEAAQEIVLAGIEHGGELLLAVTRDLGQPLRFDPALVFRAAGGADPGRVVVSDAARFLLESYLPVPACPLAGALREALLAANPWLTSADGIAEDEPAGPTAAAVDRPRVGRGGVYLIGFGGYVREQVLPHFRGEVTAAVDHKAALIRDHARPGFPVHDRLEPVLEAIAADERPLVIIASYHSDHAPQAERVLDANPEERVFVEKPPAVSAAQARCLADRQAAGAWIDVGYNRRYAPLTGALKQELAGTGRPWLLSMRTRELRLPPSHWYNWPNQGTRITGNLCHWLDLAVHLVQRPAVELSVLAADGGAAVAVSFDDGTLASLSLTDLGDDLPGVTECIEIHAPDCTILLDDFRALTVERAGRRRRIGGMRRNKGHDAMYASLRHRWLGDLPPAYPREDLVAVATLVEAAAGLFARGGGRLRFGPPASMAPAAATPSLASAR